MRKDKRTDRHDEAGSRLSQISKSDQAVKFLFKTEILATVLHTYLHSLASLLCQFEDVSLFCSSVATTGQHILCGSPDMYKDNCSLI